MLELGWFSTGRGEGSRGLLTTAQESIQRRELDARIQFVFCNREPGEHEGSDLFMALVKSYGIPLVTFSSLQYRRQRGMLPFNNIRVDYDREVMRRLKGFKPDICVLAGYMLITGPEMCQLYIMLNLHPALPGGPTGTWQDVIWKLIEGRASETGAMIHLATQELDQGPPITYFSFPLRGEPLDPYWREMKQYPSLKELKEKRGEELLLFQRIRQEGVKRERPLLLETLKAFAQGRIRVVAGKVVDTQGKTIQPLCLNREIEERLGA